MKKKLSRLMAVLCYGTGLFLSLYVGVWIMLCEPLFALIHIMKQGGGDVGFIVMCVMKILLSATISGFIWCLGYVGYNHFQGREEQEWEALEKKL